DAPAAVNLLERASGLLPERSAERLDLLVDLAEELHQVGRLQQARGTLEEALDRAATDGDAGVVARARLELANLRTRLDAEAQAADELERAAEHAVEVFERLGDDKRLARALVALADVHWIHCRVAPIEPLLERARQLAIRAGDARELSQIRYALARAAALGP